MKEGADFQPTPAPDDPHDPLLAALRQHLGENFGQEPPAALWAGIRQQLPGAPRPWWRSRRLLPLLALLVGIVALGVFSARQNGWLGGHAATQVATNKSVEGTRLQEATADNKAKTTVVPPVSERVVSKPLATAALPSTSAQPHPALGSSLEPNTATARQASTSHAGSRITTRKLAAVASSTDGQLTTSAHEPARGAHAGNTTFATELNQSKRHLATRQRALRRSGMPSQLSANPLAALSAGSALGTSTQTSASLADEQSTSSSANAIAISGSARKRTRRRAGRAALPSTHAETADVSTALGSDPVATLSRRSAHATSSAFGTGMAAVYGPPTALDSLASRRATLLLAASSLPTSLAAPADSSKPWFLPARRWSVLVLAGPTLSFRTVRSATTGGLSYSSPAATTSTQNFTNLNGARIASANVVDLERPAAGWSAQVQVRRVLTGRWAVAFGAGYQEYATRLALQVTKRTVQPSSPASSISYLDSTFSVHHRDTYRLLTLPLQLSYALGPPRGRLALSVLGGLEPSWYMGGRTTEGTSCNCEQQSFSSASGSPYNVFNLGLSLGLDARYRLGGPASRWQWVLQPTGRYVASPFVRSSTLYAQRQPYSLGLLTGLAWEF